MAGRTDPMPMLKYVQSKVTERKSRLLRVGAARSTWPILADALEEVGCDNADLLAHCRGDGLHVRGWWVVDLILGKE